FVVCFSLGGEIQQASRRVIERCLVVAEAGRIARSLDRREDFPRPVPCLSFRRAKDGPERHIEGGRPAVQIGPGGQRGDALSRGGERLTKHGKDIAVLGAHRQRTLGRATEKQRWVWPL